MVLPENPRHTLNTFESTYGYYMKPSVAKILRIICIVVFIVYSIICVFFDKMLIPNWGTFAKGIVIVMLMIVFLFTLKTKPQKSPVTFYFFNEYMIIHRPNRLFGRSSYEETYTLSYAGIKECCFHYDYNLLSFYGDIKRDISKGDGTGSVSTESFLGMHLEQQFIDVDAVLSEISGVSGIKVGARGTIT